MRCYSIHYNDVPGILCCGKLFRMVFCMPSILDSTFIVIKFPRFNVYNSHICLFDSWLAAWLTQCSWVCIFSNHIFQILFLFWNGDKIFLLTRTKHCLVPACNIFWKSGEYIERVCTFAATARVTAKKKKYNECRCTSFSELASSTQQTLSIAFFSLLLRSFHRSLIHFLRALFRVCSGMQFYTQFTVIYSDIISHSHRQYNSIYHHQWQQQQH